MQLPTIEEEWADFASRVLPPQCGTVQRREMKRALFAGYELCLRHSVMLGDENISEGEAIAFLEARKREIHNFGMDIAKGKA